MKKQSKPKTNKKTKNKQQKPINIDDNPLPRLEVISIKDNPDGSADMTYEINEAFIALIKKELNKPRVTKKQISDWVLDMLERAVKKEEGYDIKIEKKKKK